MNRATRILNGSHKRANSPFALTSVVMQLHRALTAAVQAVGEQMERSTDDAWEGLSSNGDHVWSRNDLHATGLVFQYVAEAMAREGLDVEFSLDGEELRFAPIDTAYYLRLIVDPIDGSKAFDNFKLGGDVPIPRPGSAVSIAAVCPVLGETVVTVLYCFDLAEVFSSVLLVLLCYK